MTTRAAAVREWQKILRPVRNHQAPPTLDVFGLTEFARRDLDRPLP